MACRGSEDTLRIKRAVKRFLVRQQIRTGALPRQQGPCVPVPNLRVKCRESFHSCSARSELAFLLFSEVARVVLLLNVVWFLTH